MILSWIIFGIAIAGIIYSHRRHMQRLGRRTKNNTIPPRPFMRPDYESGRSNIERRLELIKEKHHGDSPEFVRRWEDQ